MTDKKAALKSARGLVDISQMDVAGYWHIYNPEVNISAKGISEMGGKKRVFADGVDCGMADAEHIELHKALGLRVVTEDSGTVIMTAAPAPKRVAEMVGLGPKPAERKQSVNGFIPEGARELAQKIAASFSPKQDPDDLRPGLRENTEDEPDADDEQTAALKDIAGGEPVYECPIASMDGYGGSQGTIYQTRSGHKLDEGSFKALLKSGDLLVDPNRKGVYLRKGTAPGQASVSEARQQRERAAKDAAWVASEVKRLDEWQKRQHAAQLALTARR